MLNRKGKHLGLTGKTNPATCAMSMKKIVFSRVDEQKRKVEFSSAKNKIKSIVRGRKGIWSKGFRRKYIFIYIRERIEKGRRRRVKWVAEGGTNGSLNRKKGRKVWGNEVKVKLDYLCFVVYYGMMIELIWSLGTLKLRPPLWGETTPKFCNGYDLLFQFASYFNCPLFFSCCSCCCCCCCFFLLLLLPRAVMGWFFFLLLGKFSCRRVLSKLSVLRCGTFCYVKSQRNNCEVWERVFCSWSAEKNPRIVRELEVRTVLLICDLYSLVKLVLGKLETYF